MNKTEVINVEGVMCKVLRSDEGTHIFAAERVKILREKNVDYEVDYDDVELPGDNRWKVKAKLTIYKRGVPRDYTNFCIKEGAFSLETAATIALSRAIAIAGYGITGLSIGVAESMTEVRAIKQANIIENAVKNPPPPVKEEKPSQSEVEPIEEEEPEVDPKTITNFMTKKQHLLDKGIEIHKLFDKKVNQITATELNPLWKAYVKDKHEEYIIANFGESKMKHTPKARIDKTITKKNVVEVKSTFIKSPKKIIDTPKDEAEKMLAQLNKAGVEEKDFDILIKGTHLEEWIGNMAKFFKEGKREDIIMVYDNLIEPAQ